ncbi:MAG: hypothetical protein ACF8NJ_03570, partial [Phycisphaerales bacterium JB038]
MVELTEVSVVGIPRIPVPAVDIIRAEHIPAQRVGVRGGVVGVVDIAIEVDNADDTAADADTLGWDVLSSDDVNSRYGNAGYTND